MNTLDLDEQYNNQQTPHTFSRLRASRPFMAYSHYRRYTFDTLKVIGEFEAMAVQRNAHGICEVDQTYFKEQILTVRFYGSWNMQTAIEAADINANIAKTHFSGKNWGILGDIRAWELCTPEVTEYFNGRMSEFITMGYRWQALLQSNQLQKMLVDSYSDAETTAGLLTTRCFTDESEALNWLREQIRADN